MFPRRHPSSESSSSDKLDGLVLVDDDNVECLSSAGSSNSLNSTSSHHTPPVFFKAGDRTGGDCDASYNAHLTWPYGSFTGELDFDDLSPNISRASSTSSTSNRASFGRSSFRDTDSTKGHSEGRFSVKHRTTDGNRLSSESLKHCSSCSSNGSLSDDNRLHVSRKSRNGLSESSGESSVGVGFDPLLWGACPQDAPHLSTSPMAVPVPRGRPACRTRQESVSSVGSWQMVSNSGSLHGSTGSVNNAGSANSRNSRAPV